MYIHLRNGAKRLSKTSEEYLKNIITIIHKAKIKQSWRRPKKETWLYIDMIFYMPDRRVRDSHNLLKLPLDAMQSIIYINDYYVLPRIQSVEYDKHNPRVEIMISHQLQNERSEIIAKTRSDEQKGGK